MQIHYVVPTAMIQRTTRDNKGDQHTNLMVILSQMLNYLYKMKKHKK